MILRDIAIRHGRNLPTKCPACLRTMATQATIERPADRDLGVYRSRKQLRLSVVEPRVVPTYKVALRRWKRAVKVTPEKKLDLQHHHYNTFKSVGSVVEPFYNPNVALENPPKPQDVTLELLMASQTHLGHATAIWNPMNQRYIYGIRQGIHIISLETTAAHLRRAAKIVEGVAYHGGLILFVGNKNHTWSLVQAAKNAKACFLNTNWTPGSITNRGQILDRLELKVVNPKDELVRGFEERLENWPPVVPDLVVMSNTRENYTLCHECGMNNIPTIGIIDTNADPTWVTYPIPANDDSQRSVNLILGVLGRAGEEGQRKRLEAAKTGRVTWEPHPELGLPKGLAQELEEEKQKELAELAYNTSGVKGAASQTPQKPKRLPLLKDKVVVRKPGGPYVNVLGENDLWEPYDEEKDKKLDEEVAKAEKEVPEILKRLTQLDPEFEESYQEYVTGETTKASREKMRKLVEEDDGEDDEDDDDDEYDDEDDDEDDRPRRG